MGSALNLYITFSNTSIFTMLILPIQEHWKCFHLLLSHSLLLAAAFGIQLPTHLSALRLHRTCSNGQQFTPSALGDLGKDTGVEILMLRQKAR